MFLSLPGITYKRSHSISERCSASTAGDSIAEGSLSAGESDISLGIEWSVNWSSASRKLSASDGVVVPGRGRYDGPLVALLDQLLKLKHLIQLRG